MHNQKAVKVIYGTLAGLAMYAITGSLGLFLLRFCWAEYALRSEDKSYTLEMLLCRLSAGILAAMTAGISTTKIAGDNGRSAWLVALVVFCAGSYIHLLTTTWTQYPVWYHFAYLLPIIPITGFSRHFFRKRNILNSE